ncbi:MAG: hypothetical protein RhofKO_29880 [Rhodothermales bacterium]
MSSSRFVFLVLFLLISACSSSQSAVAPRGEGVQQEQVYQALAASFDGDDALGHVAFLMQYWRVGGGQPGFDASLDYVAQQLDAVDGALTHRMLETPRGGSGLVWHPLGGRLALTAPFDSVLHAFEEVPVMLMEGTPAGNATAPLVLDSESPETWNGAFVLTQSSARRLVGQAMTHGAVGVLSDNIPGYNQPEKNLDLVKYVSVGAREGGPMLFSVSRRTANRLRALKAAGEAVEIQGSVQSEVFEAPVRTLVAEIPGVLMPEERVVVVAHVDEPMANDNASGTATLTEIATTLAVRIADGTLPPPARTLTFLWVEEYTSTFAYLDHLGEAQSGIKAALVLDMVGQDVTKTGGVFRIERSPDPAAIWLRTPDEHTEWGAGQISQDELKGYFLNDLYRSLAARRAKDTGWVVGENPWEGGSDHDPFLRAGIPALLSWHFTDEFYHSSYDQIDKVSPDEMANVGITTALAAYQLAQPTTASLGELLQVLEDRGRWRIEWAKATADRLIAEGASTGDEEAVVIAAWHQWYDEALASVLTLTLPDQIEAVQVQIEAAQARLQRDFEAVQF